MHSFPAELLGSANPAPALHWPAFLSAINLEGPGLLVLAGALIYLWLTVRQLQGSLRTLEKRLESPAPAPVKASPAPAPVPALPATVQSPTAIQAHAEPDAIDEGVLTAIAATVAIVFRQPHRIIAVQPDSGTQHAWSAEGRRELYHSHRIR